MGAGSRISRRRVGSLDKARQTLNSGRLLLVAIALAIGACTSAADIRAHNEASLDELFLEADALFEGLEAAAAEHGIPIERHDAERRRMTSFWMADDAGGEQASRHRYFLAVIVHPSAGLALHARITRQVRPAAGSNGEGWVDGERLSDDEAAETALVERAYELYRERD